MRHFATPTVDRTLDGEGFTARVCMALVVRSVWFAVTPLPDDEWVITVKQDSERILDEEIAIEDGRL